MVVGWIGFGLLLWVLITIAMRKNTPPVPPPYLVGPWSGDRVGIVDSSPIKLAGSVISCPDDHWLYRITRTIARGGIVMKSTDVECIEDLMPQPRAGEPVKMDCAYCGKPWRRHIGDGRWQVHFTTGWWPEFKEGNDVNNRE